MTFDLGVIRRQRYTTPTYTSLGGIITYYNVGAVQYTAHIFLSGTTSFSVFTTSTVDLLLVGGGASGGPTLGGNGGQLREIYGATLAVGNYDVTVAAATANPATNIPGNPTSIVGTTPGTYATTATGGLSSNGVGAGGGGGGTISSPGGPGAISSIITTSIAATYGAGVNSGGSIYFAGGGGAGSGSYSSGGSGGIGGGGTGSDGSGNSKTPGTPLTGGGGGGAGYAASAAGGGSGFAMIRYITPIASLIPINDQYFNYVGLLLSNQTLDVTTPTAINYNPFTIDYLIVGGGGSGAGSGNINNYGGGGGAGGLIFGTSTNLTSGASLNITIGAGGASVAVGYAGNGNSGQPSSISSSVAFGFGVSGGTTSTLTALGGGGGGYGSSGTASSGGSGGGSGSITGALPGASIQTSYTSYTNAISRGYAGGQGNNSSFGGGGGGAGGAGSLISGGAGFTWVNGNTYAAGGASVTYAGFADGTMYTGGGGSGINPGNGGGITATGKGGDGVVIIRYTGTNVLATGGIVSTASNYVYHTFQSSGVLSIVANSTITNILYSPINYLMVGGGGGSQTASGSSGGGAGAGGLITGTFTITNLNNLLSITVGAGGAAGTNNGNNTVFTSLYVNKIAYGGGYGPANDNTGGTGGSGGGGGGTNGGSGAAQGLATQPSSASGGFGNDGGHGTSGLAGAGGGGAGGAAIGTTLRTGGIGLFVYTPEPTYSQTYAAGGPANAGAAVAGTPNTGNGAKGAPAGGVGAAGGSGIAVVWEPITNPWPTIIGNPSISTTSGYRVYAFTSTGALVFGNSLSNSNITDGSPYRYTIAPGNQPSQGSFNPYSKNWSVFFDGSSYLSIPNTVAYGTTGLGLSTTPFTIEGWVYFTSVSAGRLIGGGAGSYLNQGGWAINVSGGSLVYYLSNGTVGNSWDIANGVSMGTVVVGKWYHFALVRIGSTFTPYLNGVAGTQSTSASLIYNGLYTNLDIGNSSGSNNYLNGYLSNIRIIRGTGYYTGAFTPSTAPLPIVTNTLLIACASSYLVDKSDYNWPVTIASGTPVVKKFSPFSNLGTYNTALLGGSIYFNGSDYLTVISTATTNVPDWKYLHDGTTNYTIEGWVYPTPSTTSTIYTLLGTADSIGGTGTYIGISNLAPIWLVNNGASSYTVRGPTNSINFNVWNHIAYTFSSTNRITNIYVNGVNVATSTTSASYFNTTSAASYSLTIGRYPSYGSSINASSPYYYQGYMSNFRVAKTTSDSVVPIGLTSSTTILEYLVVAGGGGAPSSGNGRGGGGGGGFRTGTFITTQSGAIYTITVGSGGNGGNLTPTNGGNSSIVGTFISIVSAGGGTSNGVNVGGSPGGSGGGAGTNLSGKTGGAGNTPATVPAQGYDGGSVTAGTGGGGGGGAGGVGQTVGANGAGNGGAGALSNIDGLSYYYAGGGGGHVAAGATGTGGSGGGAGSNYASNTAGRTLPSSTGNGGQNTGGGGWGGASTGGAGGGGGSGCVIVRYLGPQRAVGGDIVTTNISGYTVHTFLNSGILTDYTSSYTIPGSPILPNTTATNLLLNFTDAVIVDATLQNNVYAYGDTGLSSFTKKYNKMSMYFDGTIDALVISTGTNASALGAGAFTVEMWIYPLQAYSSITAPALLDSRTTGDGAGLIRFGFNGTTLSGGPQIAWVENGTSLLTTTLVLNTWQHIAVVRNAGAIAIYNNGSQIGIVSNSTNLTVPFKYIGKSYDNLYWNGYMDDLRITNGIARYTAAFTPPTFKPQLK